MAAVERLINIFSDPQALVRLPLSEQDDLLQIAESSGALWSLLDAIDIQVGDANVSSSLLEAANRQAENESLIDRMVDMMTAAFPEGATPILLEVRSFDAYRDNRLHIDLLVKQDQRYALDETLQSMGYQEDFSERKDCVQLFRHKDQPLSLTLLTHMPTFYARKRVDIEKWFERAQPNELYSGLLSLSREDQVLCRCLRLFYNQEFSADMGALIELARLIREFESEESFWLKVLARAQELAQVRALYYGVYFLRTFMQVPVDNELKRFLEIAAPMQPARIVIEASMKKSLASICEQQTNSMASVANGVLQLRACWVNKCWSKHPHTG